MDKIEINIDSTSLGRSACILNFYRHVVEGYTQKAMGASMVYGIAVHKFIDLMYKTGGNYKDAMKEAVDIFLRLPTVDNKKSPWLRDPNHLRTTCHMIWSVNIGEDTTFQLLTLPDGSPASEQTFSFPYFEDEIVKINLCGTIDGIGKFSNGCYAIRDFKTTSSWDNQGYFKQYEMSRQLRIYTLACKIMADREPDSIIGRMGKEKMGAFIDAVFLKTKANEVVYTRSDVYQYSPETILEIDSILKAMCMKLSISIKLNHLPKEGLLNGSCEQKFGKCDFWNCCKSNEQVSQLLLSRDFNKKPFEPLRYND